MRDYSWLVNMVTDIKKAIDEALPLESGVVRDQLLVMLTASLAQTLLAQSAPGPSGEPSRLIEALNRLQPSLEAFQAQVAAELTKVAARKGVTWTSETFEHFMARLQHASGPGTRVDFAPGKA